MLRPTATRQMHCPCCISMSCMGVSWVVVCGLLDDGDGVHAQATVDHKLMSRRMRGISMSTIIRILQLRSSDKALKCSNTLSGSSSPHRCRTEVVTK